jgi:hypothetical protein
MYVLYDHISTGTSPGRSPVAQLQPATPAPTIATLFIGVEMKPNSAMLISNQPTHALPL